MSRPQEPWAGEPSTSGPHQPIDTPNEPQAPAEPAVALPSEPLQVDPLWDSTALGWLTATGDTQQPDTKHPGYEQLDATDVGGECAVVDGEPVEDGGGEGAVVVELMFAGVEPWVRDILAPTFPRRATPQFRWCAQWWRHPEAVLRLEALWRSWEVARADMMVGTAGWLREHLDPQLAVLTSPAGPFCECDPTRHFDPAEPALPLQAAPAGWWDTPDHGHDDDEHGGRELGAGGLPLERLDLTLLEHGDADQRRGAGEPVQAALAPAQDPGAPSVWGR